MNMGNNKNISSTDLDFIIALIVYLNSTTEALAHIQCSRARYCNCIMYRDDGSNQSVVKFEIAIFQVVADC